MESLRKSPLFRAVSGQVDKLKSVIVLSQGGQDGQEGSKFGDSSGRNRVFSDPSIPFNPQVIDVQEIVARAYQAGKMDGNLERQSQAGSNAGSETSSRTTSHSQRGQTRTGGYAKEFDLDSEAALLDSFVSNRIENLRRKASEEENFLPSSYYGHLPDMGQANEVRQSEAQRLDDIANLDDVTEDDNVTPADVACKVLCQSYITAKKNVTRFVNKSEKQKDQRNYDPIFHYNRIEEATEQMKDAGRVVISIAHRVDQDTLRHDLAERVQLSTDVLTQLEKEIEFAQQKVEQQMEESFEEEFKETYEVERKVQGACLGPNAQLFQPSLNLLHSTTDKPNLLKQDQIRSQCYVSLSEGNQGGGYNYTPPNVRVNNFQAEFQTPDFSRPPPLFNFEPKANRERDHDRDHRHAQQNPPGGGGGGGPSNDSSDDESGPKPPPRNPGNDRGGQGDQGGHREPPPYHRRGGDTPPPDPPQPPSQPGGDDDEDDEHRRRRPFKMSSATQWNREPRYQPPGREWVPPENDREDVIRRKQQDVKFDNTMKTVNWYKFQAAYTVQIGSRKIRDEEKLIHLLSLLEGEPALIASRIAGDEYTREAYHAVWAALEEAYGGIVRQRHRLYNELMKWPKMKEFTHQNTLELTSLISNICRCFARYNGQEELDATGTINLTVQGILPSHEAKNYFRWLARKRRPNNLHTLYEFLEAERAALAHASILNSEIMGKSYPDQDEPPPSKVESEEERSESSSKGEMLPAETFKTNDRSRKDTPQISNSNSF